MTNDFATVRSGLGVTASTKSRMKALAALDRIEAALRPFARFSDCLVNESWQYRIETSRGEFATLETSDFRNAAACLAEAAERREREDPS